MPLSPCQYVAIQIYWSWNCGQNSFAKWFLIYSTQQSSLHLWNIFHAVRWFSRAPERRLPATQPQTHFSGWRIPLWTSSAHLKWYHWPLSPADSLHGWYQWYSTFWPRSQHWIDRPVILHACRQFCLLPHKPQHQKQSSFYQLFWHMSFWDQIPLSQHPAIVVALDVGTLYRIACIWQVSPDGLCDPITLLPSADQHLTI